MRSLALAVAVLLLPTLAESQFRYNLNTSAGFTHVGKEDVEDTANRDEYVNFSTSAFYEFPSNAFVSGLCVTEGAPGELAWSTPSTWKRGYCDVAAGYFAFQVPEQKLRAGLFGFVGQQFKITTPEGGFRAEPYPMRWGGGVVLYFGEKSWLYAAVFRDETLREEGASFGTLFQTDLLQVGSKAALASRTRVTIGKETTVSQEAVFSFGG